HRRRERPGRGAAAAGDHGRLPGPAAVLGAGLRLPGPLPGPVRFDVRREGKRMSTEVLVASLLTIIGAATPLLLAALGELVTERAGVLNLGVEGMMLAGAVMGFAITSVTGSGSLGIVVAALAGMAMALLFGVLTLSLLANQVATGLAL